MAPVFMERNFANSHKFCVEVNVIPLFWTMQVSQIPTTCKNSRRFHAHDSFWRGSFKGHLWNTCMGSSKTEMRPYIRFKFKLVVVHKTPGSMLNNGNYMHMTFTVSSRAAKPKEQPDLPRASRSIFQSG